MTPFPGIKLTPGQIQQFKREGFLSIDRLIDDQTLEALRREYDLLIGGEIECGEDRRLLGGLINQVMNPSRHSLFIRDNPAVQAGKEIAAQITNAPAASRIRVLFDMLIDKPAGTKDETPWHQDFAYSAMPMRAAGTAIPDLPNMHFWVALDDVDIDNGCMQFMPGLHTSPLLAHHVYSGDPDYEGRLLAIDHIDSSQAVAHPLRAGGCTIHHYATPHYTGPNKTQDRKRRAYIFNLVWDPSETDLSLALKKIKKRPARWLMASTFLWLPVAALCFLYATHLFFQNHIDSRGIINLAVWSYPFACMISAFCLSRIPKGKIRWAIMPNLAAIPLWGLALYYYHGLFQGIW